MLSQLYLAPLLLLLDLAGVRSGATPDRSPDLRLGGRAMLPCSVWLTVTLIGPMDEAHRSIVTSASSHLREAPRLRAQTEH
ncbi:hypothetical protein ACFT7U_22060 [Streptomyces rochei]|uniref:hypothetical protein n=1 Tax=Streptomyces rochei TaxID=1928 RepID=UPI00362A827E